MNSSRVPCVVPSVAGQGCELPDADCAAGHRTLPRVARTLPCRAHAGSVIRLGTETRRYGRLFTLPISATVGCREARLRHCRVGRSREQGDSFRGQGHLGRDAKVFTDRTQRSDADDNNGVGRISARRGNEDHADPGRDSRLRQAGIHQITDASRVNS